MNCTAVPLTVQHVLHAVLRFISLFFIVHCCLGSGGRRNFISTPETYDKLGVTVRNKKGTDAEHTMIRSIQDDVSGIRMKEAMCPEWNYFQVKVTATVGDGKIGIGIAHEKYPLSNFPGWMSGSIGYHADDGGLFFDGNHQLLGPTCKVGDRMGCGVDFSTVADGPIRVWFTKNDQLVYYHTMKLQVDSASKFYPLISMETSGQEVQYMGHCQKRAPIDGKLTAMVLLCRESFVHQFTCSLN